MNKIKFVSIAAIAIIVTLAQCFQFALADKNNKLQDHKQLPFVPVQKGNTHGKSQNSSYNITQTHNGIKKRKKMKNYIFWSGGEAGRREIIQCPNHAFGTMKDGLKELQRRLKTKKENETILSQLCVSAQLESIKMYSPFLDIIGINPFVKTSQKKPSPETPIWPSFDHPMINRIRQMRELAGDTLLLARIGIGGIESVYITKRPPTFEEVKWEIYATIGAGFKGVIWVGGFYSGGKLRRMASEIERYAFDLGRANFVTWVKSDTKQPMAALCSEKRLFVILLNDEYFLISKLNDKSKLSLPLGEEAKEVEITLFPPIGIALERAITIGGRTVPIMKKGNFYFLKHRLKSSADILVLDIKRLNHPINSEEAKKKGSKTDEKNTTKEQ